MCLNNFPDFLVNSNDKSKSFHTSRLAWINISENLWGGEESDFIEENKDGRDGIWWINEGQPHIILGQSMLAYGHYTILKPLYWCMLVSIYINNHNLRHQWELTSHYSWSVYACIESFILYWCVLVLIHINRYSWSQFIAWKYSEVMEKRKGPISWADLGHFNQPQV